MNRRRAWVAVAIAAVLPLAFASPAGAISTGDQLPGAYAGELAAAERPGSGGLSGSAHRTLASAEGAAVPQDAALAASSEQLTELAEEIGALGVYYDQPAGEFVLVLPAEATNHPAEITALADPVRVEVSELSTSTVDSFTAAVEAREFHPSAAQYSYGSYVDVTQDVLVLGTNAPADVVTSLVAGYGEQVEVRYGDEAGRARGSDPVPHWGGASITNGGPICSSGFTVQSGGQRFMMTAGHCFNTNNQVFSTVGGQAWGTFHPHVNLPDPDLAIIAGTSYQGAIYIGGVNSTTGAAVSSFGNPVMGFNNYCFSGQTSGEVCGHSVVSFNGTLCDPLGCTFNLVVSNGQSVLPGDSGSPWFVHSTGGVFPAHIRGLTVGVIAGQSYWHSYGTIASTGVTGVPFP